jgi:hypothetical protein
LVDSTTRDTTLAAFADATSIRLIAQNNARTAFKTLNLDGSDIRFLRGGGECARVDDSGRLLVGTSTSVTTVLDSPKLQVFVGDQGAASFVRGSNNEFGPNIHFAKSRNTASGSRTIVQNNDELGSIFFIGDDGTDLDQSAARIYCQVDGTPGANDMPGRLVFSTTADGASSPTERMRISSTGAVTCTSTVSDGAGDVRSIPQNAQTAAYTLAATDNGEHISITTGGVTVPSGVFSVGQAVTIFNNSASSQAITQGTSVTLRQGGTANTGNRTLAQYGVATVLCVGTNTFVITGAGLS